MSEFPPGSFPGHRSVTRFDGDRHIVPNNPSNYNSFRNNPRPVQGHSNYMANPPCVPQTTSFPPCVPQTTSLAAAMAAASLDSDSPWVEAFMYTMELPKLAGGNLNLAVAGDRRVLTVSGVEKIEREENVEGAVHVHHSFQNFQHTVSLPEGASADSYASFPENGVLFVVLFKDDGEEE